MSDDIYENDADTKTTGGKMASVLSMLSKHKVKILIAVIVIVLIIVATQYRKHQFTQESESKQIAKWSIEEEIKKILNKQKYILKKLSE